MTLAGRHIFDEHLLFSDMPCQIHRLGEQEELDLVRLHTDNEVLFYFLPLCVKLARLVPAPLLSSTAAASLPPSLHLSAVQHQCLAQGMQGAFDFVFSQPGKRLPFSLPRRLQPGSDRWVNRSPFFCSITGSCGRSRRNSQECAGHGYPGMLS